MLMKRVLWTSLVVGDVVAITGRLQKLIRIIPGTYGGPGTTLEFGSGHSETQYKDLAKTVKDRPHYCRALRPNEKGYRPISRKDLYPAD